MTKHLFITADNLVKNIKHFLITHLGKVEKEASIEEFYYAFCIALREEVMLNWTATKRTFHKHKAKTIYYLSMEYLPGKFLQNNITNLNAQELVKTVLKKCDRNLSDLVRIDPDVGLGNGGLGRLASCFLDSLATQKYPAMGYGLRYHYGIFEQEIFDGIQIERPDCWLLSQYPWEFRKDSNASEIYFHGKMIPDKNIHNDEIFVLEDYEAVRAIPYDIPIIGYSEEVDFLTLSLRLWSTKESPRNFELQKYNAGDLGPASENTSLTDVLYPNDYTDTGKRIRLKQEFLLVCASLQDILKRHMHVHENIDLLQEKVQIQINDTHPALVVAELMRRLVKNFNMPWNKAFEITQNCCNFTNHTVMKEALEEWDSDRIKDLLPRQHRIIEKINQELCNKIRAKYPGDDNKLKNMSIIENNKIKMANLAIYGSKKVNGVAKLHTEILKHNVFPDFYEMYPEKFIAITNGVTPRKWLINCNPLLTKFISDRIGTKWTVDLNEISKLHDFAEDKKTQEEFLEIKKENKRRLLDFLTKENPVRDFKGRIISHSPTLDETALFDVQIKRFHEYKRQLLNALHILMIINDLKEDPNSRKIKRMVVIGGKAAPGYKTAKETMALFYALSRKIQELPYARERIQIAFVENYNVTKAEMIIPAADLSEQISTAGLEASGTGNMKLSMNGALTIATEDGANIEMKEAVGEKWWPFSFGSSAQEIHTKILSKEYKPWEVYLQHPKVKNALDWLTDGSLARNDYENAAFNNLYEILLDHFKKIGTDPFFVMNDLLSYYDTQKKVEDLFVDRNNWAKYAIHNIASMGTFSSDIVIKKYAKEVWDIIPCPLDMEILAKVKEEYSLEKSCQLKEPKIIEEQS